MSRKMDRRQFIKTVGGAAAGLAAGRLVPAGEEKKTVKGSKRSRVLRIAHLTDIHIQPEKKGGEWTASCLHHIQNQKDRPDVIFNGGDTIMDSLHADRARTKLQWDLWIKIVKNECSIPVENCIGNHDVWGWDKKKSGAKATDPLYGKKWALEALGLSKRYRSFNRAGWHFIVLDSTHPHEGNVYTARLDEEQFSWLASDLKKADEKTPVCILSHIPILCACVFFDGENEKSGNWVVPHRWMHIDARRIKDLLYKHPNVKLCLSGHVHLQDRVDYNNITYLCNGAVCGGWWKGNYQEAPPGYALINLNSDGTFDHEYVTYGWKEI